MDTNGILLERKEYDHLVEDALFLQVLEDFGVNNWPGYEDAEVEFRRRRGVKNND